VLLINYQELKGKRAKISYGTAAVKEESFQDATGKLGR